MKHIIVCIWYLFFAQYVACDPDIEIMNFLNRTTPADRQLYDFKLDHPNPIGVLTTSAGQPVDIRDTFTTNMNQYINEHHITTLKNIGNKRIVERLVHAKGTGAWGYFVVDNDISQYTSADVFNGVGKKTQIFGRFSTGNPHRGGTDLARDIKGLAIKFYTKEGNLDFLCINFPVYFYRDTINFDNFISSFNLNGKTNLKDFTSMWDFVTKKPETLAGVFWLLSDYGISNGYRKMEYFPIHTYELRNKQGERYFAKFNVRSEQGVENIDSSEARRLSGEDPDYYIRDLYNAIEDENYPVWTLEMYVMSFKDILNVGYDPFDVTRLWKKGTYKTITVGRFIFNQNLDNFFKYVELSSYNPGNLVPGIPGPIDALFRGRLPTYRDAHIHRLGVNHNRIPVNEPLYRKGYNRDGKPPVAENQWDAPNYFPNSFSGPVPYVDKYRPKDSLSLLQCRAVDLQEPAYFYYHILTSEAQRDRFINNTVAAVLPTAPYIQLRVIKLYNLIDSDIGKKLRRRLKEAMKHPGTAPPKVLKVYREKDHDSYH